jgi:hypothetical protein
METETTATSPSRRPRTWLLVLLALVAAGFATMTLRDTDSADPVVQTSNPSRPSRQAQQTEKLDPEELDVRLEALKRPPPQPDDIGRNPFRFKPKPPPVVPSTPASKSVKPGGPPPPPPPPPGPPPIPLKFIGVTEAPAVGKIAALTDCRHTVQGVEGEVIEGQYRIVKIGIESLVIEYLDGKGRTTLRMSGAECVAK